MFKLLAALSFVAFLHGVPNTISAKTVLANVPDRSVSISGSKCPDGYFSANVPLKALTFQRGKNVKRKNTPLSNFDQVQCAPFPDTVNCEFKDGEKLCVSDDLSQPDLPAVEYVIDCELAPDDESCFLEDSCFLRCYPDGYFFAGVSSKNMTFRRGRQVTRKNTPLSNLDQVQCAPLPDTVNCELKSRVISCNSGDSNQTITPGVEFSLDCERAPNDANYWLEDSCFLRCNTGLSTLAIIGIVLGVLIAVGLIAVIVAWCCRRN